MLPLVSQPTWPSRKGTAQGRASTGLPAFTTNLKMGFPMNDRTTTPWRRTSHGGVSPNKNYVQWPLPQKGYDSGVKVNTKDFETPHTMYKEKSFRSSTVLRQVPIMRRHLDTFGGRIFSIPARTKSVPVHTGRFLFDPSTSIHIPQIMTQNERLAAEEDLIKRVRGQKRKREALEHRWGWRNFDLSGEEVSRFERFNIHSEVEKLKALILPTEARDIYTGKGIRLPRSHHTRSPHKQLPKDGSFPTPLGYNTNPNLRSSAKIVSALGRNYDQTEVPPTTPKPITAWEARLQSQQAVPSLQGGLIVQSMPVPGLHSNQTPKPPSRPLLPETPANVETQENQPNAVNVQQTLKMHEQVETIEVVKPEAGDRELLKSEIAVIPETPIDRPRSLMAPSASPEIFVPNPLSPMPLLHQDFMSENKKEDLMKQYNNLNRKGTVEFPDMLKLSEASLSNNQIQYLRLLYEVTSQKSVFGDQEFVAFACLAKIIENLGPESAQHFNSLAFESLPESITQYSELFASVDRTNKGQIGVTALIQILSTTLQTNLKTDKLLSKIMGTLNKVGDETISKLEFLANLPFFISLEGAE